MKKKIRTLLQTTTVVFVSIFIVAGAVGAATTIGTNIITGGTLSVTGTSTLGIIDAGVWNGTAIDVSDYTNLGVSDNLLLTGDTLGVAAGYEVPLTASTTDWNTAFGWGDHSLAGYLTSVEIATDTDLTVTDNLLLTGNSLGVAASNEIPLTASTTEWATAYGWGNHDSAGYLTSETDPIAGAINGIIAADGVGNFSAVTDNSANWDTAFGWGDHSGLYDPLGTATTTITNHEATYNHTNYDTAYGWGDHSLAGYLLASSTQDLDMNFYDIVAVGDMGVSNNLSVGSSLTVASSTASSTVTVGVSGSSAACLKLQDTDKAGWTYCSFLDGVMTCSTTSCE